uniref:Uncharacterized protein n=1 Tax=Tetraselmis sp. GSL018 TaxID=582737 RepID=A0A061QWD5_9CHLO|eukprot:CAMPEP_0177614026 /NCGR_PEP_ID=MMETSP0419_2-20121207/22385_1 /TAXON_ID=582737 /ORGANISM="Tetraselmis sp., Strain GSL018" /LENGTH=163 /DNA_ID=CAMNT_0019110955 /DNA_START=146 /DNA_END=637 /DNA_ORIENTATION=+
MVSKVAPRDEESTSTSNLPGFFGDGRKLLQINGIACKLEGEYAWALSAGTMSLGISGIALLLGILAPPAYEIIAAPLAVLLFLIWIPGTLVTTFLGTISIDSPNGYYAAWAAFVLSFNFMAARLSKTKRPNVKYTAQQPRSRKKTSHLKKQEETSDDDDYDDV